MRIFFHTFKIYLNYENYSKNRRIFKYSIIINGPLIFNKKNIFDTYSIEWKRNIKIE